MTGKDRFRGSISQKVRKLYKVYLFKVYQNLPDTAKHHKGTSMHCELLLVWVLSCNSLFSVVSGPKEAAYFLQEGTRMKARTQQNSTRLVFWSEQSKMMSVTSKIAFVLNRRSIDGEPL